MTKQVWVLSIEHKHGTTVFVADSKNRVYDELDRWVRYWWKEEVPDTEGEIPDDPDEARDIYFDYSNEFWSVARTDLLSDSSLEPDEYWRVTHE